MQYLTMPLLYLSQICIGFIAWDLISFPTTSRVVALLTYRSMVTRVLLDGGDTIMPTATRLHFQERFCQFWLGCFASFPSSWCGECSIPDHYLPNGTTPESLYPGARERLFVQQVSGVGDYETSSLSWSITSMVISFCASFYVLRTFGRVWLLQCLVMSMAIACMAGLMGLSYAAFDPSVDTSVCGSPDLNPAASAGTSTLSLQCLFTNGASSLTYEMMSIRNRSLAYGSGVSAIVLLLEATGFLSTVVERLRGINDWARLEMKILMWSFLGAVGAMLIVWALRTSGALASLDDQFHDILRFAHRCDELFGHSPLWDLGFIEGVSEEKLAKDQTYATEHLIWANPAALGAMLVLTVIHILSLAVVARAGDDEYLWSRWRVLVVLRLVLVTDMILFCTYVLLNLVVASTQLNAPSLLLVLFWTPLMVQLFFALLYAVQSDIFPIIQNLPRNQFLRKLVFGAILLPTLGLVLFTVGLAFQLGKAYNPTLGVAVAVPMMLSGLAVLMVVLLALGALYYEKLLKVFSDCWDYVSARYCLRWEVDESDE